MKALYLFFFLALPYSNIAQNLNRAIENYYANIHFTYDSDLIRSSKIQSLESVDFHPLGDSLRKTSRRNKFEFHPFGKPLCEQCNSRVEYEPKITFEYDSLNRLLKKSILTPSPKNYRQLRPNDIYVWKYNEAGELYKVLRYMMIDRLHQGNGVSYFPEKMMLFACDSIFYNYTDSSVTIFQNYREHCLNDSIELHPHSFNPRKIQLLFHSNGNLKERHTFEGKVRLSVEFYDSLGRPTKGQSNSCSQRLFEALDFSGELPKELLWLVYDHITTLVDTDSLLVFGSMQSNQSEFGYVTSFFQGEQSSNHELTVDLKTGTLQFENETVGGYINHRGNVLVRTRHKVMFDDQLHPITHETWTSSSGDGLYEFEIQEEDLNRNNPGRYAITKYEYYENGMLKSLTDFDSEGNLLHQVVNEATYFE